MKEYFIVYSFAIYFHHHVEELFQFLRSMYMQLCRSAKQGHCAYQSWESEDMVSMIVTDEDVTNFQHAKSMPLHSYLHTFTAIDHVILASHFQYLCGGKMS